MCWKDNTLQSHRHKQILHTKMSWKSREEAAQQNCSLTFGCLGGTSPREVHSLTLALHEDNESHEAQANTAYNSRWWNMRVLISSKRALLWHRPFPPHPARVSNARKITVNGSSAARGAERSFQLWTWNEEFNSLQLHTKRVATSFNSRNALRVKLTFEQRPAQDTRNPQIPPPGQWALMRLTHWSTLVFLSVKPKWFVCAKKSSLASFFRWSLRSYPDKSRLSARLYPLCGHDLRYKWHIDASFPDWAKSWGIWQAARFCDGCFGWHCFVLVVKQHIFQTSV